MSAVALKSRSYSSYANYASMRYSTERKFSSTQPRVSSKPAQSPTQKVDDIKLIKANVKGNTANSLFVFVMLAVLIGTFLAVMLINIALSSLSIQATDMETQIAKTKQDTQQIRVQMEQKGTAIPDQAAKLGMVLRDKTIVITLSTNQTNDYNSSKTEADKAYEENVRR
jgi:cell division protein FtsL